MGEDFMHPPFQTYPSKNSEGKKHIVIVGGGIIGCCTAYYLTQHPSFSPSTHHITIIESRRIAGGASGKAGGLLASWAFPHQIVPLSFQLHQELSDQYDGENNWDYRRLTTVSLEADVREEVIENYEKLSKKAYNLNVPPPKKRPGYVSSKFNIGDSNSSLSSSGSSLKNDTASNEEEGSEVHVSSSVPSLHSLTNERMRSHTNSASDLDSVSPAEQLRETNIHNPLPTDLNWIRRELVNDWSSLGGTDTTAQLHPYKFTHFILSKAMETGAVDLLLGKVVGVKCDEMDCVHSLKYLPSVVKNRRNSRGHAENSDIKLGTIFNDENAKPIEINDIQQIVLSMGPWTSKILKDCPISGLRAHSVTIKPSEKTVSPYAILAELKVNDREFFSPEMYARKDEVYVCGEGDTLVNIPESSDDVEVVSEKCDELYHYVSKLSPTLSKGHLLRKQACFLPVLNVPTSSGPLIGETNVKDLYIASGHSCWGINNAPATGKLMAEILLDGEATSAEISSLDPKLYFDATILP
ncbi:Tda3p [Saccharomyces paradoxus]|uniref:Tda3p n=1 Tax=Saccharomyces paradoxus TaxID=27291 RepID=A0A8B8USF3_SACPA|nr:Tda3 [Saccharomyces paradoxus]QHS73647.1 Tda3 [Saccharomyces paradoxus]